MTDPVRELKLLALDAWANQQTEKTAEKPLPKDIFGSRVRPISELEVPSNGYDFR
jgi:hypothetical protein